MKGEGRIDHLVVYAEHLDAGVAWCEAVLGVTPAAGGEHAFMGTHNRLVNLSSPAHPRTYLEIIAINKIAEKALQISPRRWFDLDNAALRAQVAQRGPQLIHWVAAVPHVAQARDALAAQGIDRGPVLPASRATPHGLLRWRITVRPDGQRLMNGCLPTLIEWGAAHPCDHMPASGVTLQSLTLAHPEADALRAACAALDVAGVTIQAAARAQLHAVLHTPRGLVAV